MPASSTNSPGFESGVAPSTRRALFDLRRDNTNLSEALTQVIQDLDQVTQDLADLVAATTPTPWVPITTFMNGWVPLGGIWVMPQIRLEGDKAHIRGSIAGGIVENGSVICLLDPPYQPPGQLSLATEGGADFKWVLVDAAGILRWHVPVTQTTANPTQTLHFNHSWSVTP